jgi:hypothetical protein
MTKEEAYRFFKKIYSSTTYSHKMVMVAFNDKYVLAQKPPSTEYVDRVRGCVYSASEWLLIAFDCTSNDLSHSPSKCALFYKEGALKKVDKDKLKSEFGIELPKKEVNKKMTENKWVVGMIKSAGWFHYYESDFFIYKIIKDTKETIIVDNRGNEKSFSKNKYYLQIFDVEATALNEYLKSLRLAREYNQMKNSLSVKKDELLKIFKEQAIETLTTHKQ